MFAQVSMPLKAIINKQRTKKHLSLTHNGYLKFLFEHANLQLSNHKTTQSMCIINKEFSDFVQSTAMKKQGNRIM